jgi:Zn-dependent protease with chaperone function
MTVSVQQERALGQQAFEQTLNEYRGRILPANDPRVQFVRRVAARIVRATAAQQQTGSIRGHHLPSTDEDHGVRPAANQSATAEEQTQWEVFVVKDDQQPNAFVLPNGKIFVFTGILPICKDEDGLATVLGHEVAHQVARHSAEKMAGSFVTTAIGFLFEFILPGSYMASRQALTLLKELPNSRAVESEADRIGLRLMSAACYDPTKAPDLWRRMQEMEQKSSSGGRGLEIFSTHPISERRMHNLQDWSSEAIQIRQDSGCNDLPSRASFGNAMRDSLMGRSSF